MNPQQQHTPTSFASPRNANGSAAAAAVSSSLFRRRPPAAAAAAGGGEGTTQRRSMVSVDLEYKQLACLGHGGFGSVFLARKRGSGRQVALKFLPITTTTVNEVDDDDPQYEAFTRELHAVTRLNNNNTEENNNNNNTASWKNNNNNNNRDLSIVFFEQWFHGPGFACIAMNYVEGGTLAEDIQSRYTTTTDDQQNNPHEILLYTERRIAWYALQLSEALSYAHERGVAHHDVKSSNVLVDRKRGGKLLLADFGSAVAPGEESVRFTEIYASPELLAAYGRDEFDGLQADKIDSFGLGCILYELVCCRKLVDMTGEQTLAEFIQANGVDPALDSPCVKLPWLPLAANTTNKTDDDSSSTSTVSAPIGYSHALQCLIKTLLDPCPTNRWLPSDLATPLRMDPQSPLLHPRVVAAQPPVPGAPVTVDNVQLGMFVQRGEDWNEEDEDADGGPDSIGVVVQLDADAGYCNVAWPAAAAAEEQTLEESILCRIGAGNKFELQVGPTPLPDFYECTATARPMESGLMTGISTDGRIQSVGQLINSNCRVVAIYKDQDAALVGPVQKIHVPRVPFPRWLSQGVVSVGPRSPKDPPDHWQQPNDADHSLLFEVNDLQERESILELFHSADGGLDIQACEILSLKRVQLVDLWREYAQRREDVAAENWGLPNEQRLFHGMGYASLASLLVNPRRFYGKCCTGDGNLASSQKNLFSKDASYADAKSFRSTDGNKQMVLSLVTLGRTLEDQLSNPVVATGDLDFHSELLKQRETSDGKLFTIRNTNQAFPEYIICYKETSIQRRRIVRAARSANSRARIRASRRATSSGGRASNGLESGRNCMATSRNNKPSVPAPAVSVAASTQKSEQSSQSATKMCVVCLERPVCRILVPCGHPCLCQICSTAQGLAKLKMKCPECRASVREAVTFYGRIAND